MANENPDLRETYLECLLLKALDHLRQERLRTRLGKAWPGDPVADTIADLQHEVEDMKSGLLHCQSCGRAVERLWEETHLLVCHACLMEASGEDEDDEQDGTPPGREEQAMGMTEGQVTRALRLFMGRTLCRIGMTQEQAMLFVYDHELQLLGALEEAVEEYHAALGPIEEHDEGDGS
jgi:hypothetical protein